MVNKQHEKMFNIISHERNVNQSCNEIPLHKHQDVYNQKEVNKFWQRCRESGILIHV